MITNGFTYVAVLIFIAALLVWLQKRTTNCFTVSYHYDFLHLKGMGSGGNKTRLLRFKEQYFVRHDFPDAPSL